MSNASLAIYLGESYAELEVRADTTSAPTTKGKIAANTLFKKNYFLPQTSLKAILNQQIKPLLTDYQISKVFIVTRYLDRLKSFRLGGSVIQVLNANQENNYTFEDSNNLSLAAASLIITLDQDSTIEHLTAEVERVKKINPEANKVVISLQQFNSEKLDSIKTFFKETGFTVFLNPDSSSLKSLRQTLINAGSEGTKEEILTDIKEALNSPEIYFWINDSFKNSFSNIDLYFSADSFLSQLLNDSKREILIHTDIERWSVLKNKKTNIWKSPWGKISYPHIETEQIGLSPFAEVKINPSGHLSFSKIPAAIEPGPMLAGRSVKTLIIDVFYKSIAESEHLQQMFPQLATSNLVNKIESQFKVLEKGQIHYDEPLNLQIIQDFIINKLGYDILLHKTKEEKILWTGHLNTLFKRLDNEVSLFSWTTEMFKRT